jgi:hypothetical protein
MNKAQQLKELRGLILQRVEPIYHGSNFIGYFFSRKDFKEIMNFVGEPNE